MLVLTIYNENGKRYLSAKARKVGDYYGITVARERYLYHPDSNELYVQAKGQYIRSVYSAELENISDYIGGK